MSISHLLAPRPLPHRLLPSSPHNMNVHTRTRTMCESFLPALPHFCFVKGLHCPRHPLPVPHRALHLPLYLPLSTFIFSFPSLLPFFLYMRSLRTGREASSLKWVRARTQSSPTTSLFNCHPYMKGVQCVVENHSMVLRLLRVGGALPRLETGGGRQQTTLMLIIYEVNNSTKKNGKRSSMWVLSGYRTRTLLFTLSYCS